MAVAQGTRLELLVGAWLSRMTWTALPSGTASMALRKRMDPRCLWRCVFLPMKVPSSI
jgi:hypothetical protein